MTDDRMGSGRSGLVADPAAVVDCRGQRCPLPVISLAKHLSMVEIGQVVRVIADDPATANDIPAWCRIKKQEYVGGGSVEVGGAHAGMAEAAPAFDVRRIV